jgi:hypothetical protein
MFDTQDQATKPNSHYEQVIDVLAERHVKTEAIEMMRQCIGWCSEQKGEFLVDLILKAKPEIVVEIGVWGGKSLVPMARALKANKNGVIYGIDPWNPVESLKEVMEDANRNYWGQIDHLGTKQSLEQNIRNFSLEKNVVLIQSTSEDAAPIQGIGLLHVDGNHSEKMSYLDVTKWVPFVKSGGYIILDDMTWYEKGNFTTKKACEWMDANCIKLAEFDDNCKWGLWVKP